VQLSLFGAATVAITSASMWSKGHRFLVHVLAVCNHRLHLLHQLRG